MIDYSSPTNGSWLVGQSAATTARGQAFSPLTSEVIDTVGYTVDRDGSPADDLIVEIQSDSGNAPSGTVLATVATIAGGDVPASPTFLTTSGVGLSVTGGVKYWLVVRRSGAIDAANFYNWEHNSLNPYVGYDSNRYNGASWVGADATIDASFRITFAVPEAIPILFERKGVRARAVSF